MPLEKTEASQDGKKLLDATRPFAEASRIKSWWYLGSTLVILGAVLDQLREFWPHVAALLNLVISLVASGHAVLSKRDTRAAIGWVGIIWLAPLVGTLLYVWLGINRIERRARSLRSDRPRPELSPGLSQCPGQLLDETLGPDGAHLRSLVTLVGDVTRRPLLNGNRVAPLVNGDQAYPAMLDAIDASERNVTLSTYMFGNDRAGKRFLDALQRAVARGVEVRVLIDDVGARYTWPTMPRLLRRAGIPCATFLPTLIPWRFQYSNLRTHRKIMVVDGCIGFVGGMNIGERCCLDFRRAASVAPNGNVHLLSLVQPVQ